MILFFIHAKRGDVLRIFHICNRCRYGRILYLIMRRVPYRFPALY